MFERGGTVCGCIFFSMSSCAWRKNSPASTQTEVVPSPTSSSCTFEMSISTFAAGFCAAACPQIGQPLGAFRSRGIGGVGARDEAAHVDEDRLEDGGAVVGHRDVAPAVGRLQDLIHPLGTERGFYKVGDRQRADDGRLPGGVWG